MSIKKSLRSLILLMAVIPVIIMAILAYVIATTKNAAIHKDNIQKTSADFSYGFYNQLNSQLVQTTALSQSNELRSLLLEKINSPDALLSSKSQFYTKLIDTLDQAANNFDHLAEYFVYDIDGYLIASTSENTPLDWEEVMTKAVDEYDELVIIPSSSFTKNSLDIIVPVTVKGKTIGLIRCNVDANYFGAFLSEDNNNFIVDENGKCLFGYDPTSEDDLQFLTYLIGLDKDSIKEASAYDQTHEFIYGYCPVPNYDWIYVAKQSTSSYNNIVSSLPIAMIILLCMVIILSWWLSNSLADKYTSPILELNEKMQSAADGKLDVHSEFKSNDEFGTLSENFNQMMDIISTNYNELSRSKDALAVSQENLHSNLLATEHLAYTDALTGLANRMAFYKYAEEIISTSKNIQNRAVIFIDLDGFKSINDTLGHDYGDLLLKEVANQLSSYVSPGDILARNGGDEFVILRKEPGTRTELENFMASLVSIAKHPFILEDETVHVTLSAGAAVFPINGLTLTELMKNADIAMYASKNTGKNSYTFFNSSMEDEVNRRNDLIDILKDAVENKEIYLFYQPLADATTGRITGCEALMRLNSPVVGYVSPDEFIPVAEEAGLIDELGEWALTEACNFNKRIVEAGFDPLKMSVNISTAQLRGNRLKKIIESLPEKTDMPLEHLEIELTESVLMKNFEHNLTVIDDIKKLGVQVALDDFGTGYSSFSYLTKIPIDTLKIDRSFIAGIDEDSNEAYISNTIINLAHHLGIKVVAEGVETIEQLRILQSQMCDELQGYFFSRPVNEKDFLEMLKINSQE